MWKDRETFKSSLKAHIKQEHSAQTPIDPRWKITLKMP